MLGHEVAYISECIHRNTTQDSERTLATLLAKTETMLCDAETVEDLRELSRLLSLVEKHPVVQDVIANSPTLVWNGETGIAIAYLAWISQRFYPDWEGSFSNRIESLAKLPDANGSLFRLREQLQEWQQGSPLKVVDNEWEPHKHFLLDLVAVFAIWSMTRMKSVEDTLYPRLTDFLTYEHPFILVYMACACLTHENLPILFGTMDVADWDRYDRCHALLQRFGEIVKDND